MHGNDVDGTLRYRLKSISRCLVVIIECQNHERKKINAFNEVVITRNRYTIKNVLSRINFYWIMAEFNKRRSKLWTIADYQGGITRKNK